MQTPLAIIFHQVTPSAALKAFIRRQAEKLEKRSPKMLSCRVLLAAGHRAPGAGVPDVHIEIALPGGQVVITHKPLRERSRRAAFRYQDAAREAFAAAALRLSRLKR